MYKIENRNIGIDLLRGLCIIYIVCFWHMLNYTNAVPNYNNIVTYRITWIILATFVFISGYFIGQGAFEIKKQYIVSFYTKKVIRIYPLYLSSIMLFMYLGLLDLKTSIKAILMVSMFLRPSPPTLWFVTMIMTFYIISPVLIFACKNIKLITIIIMYVIFSSLCMLYYYFTFFLDVRIIMYLPAFIFGLFVAINGESKVDNKYLFIALFIGILGILISFLSNTQYIAVNWLLATMMVTIFPYFLFIAFRKIPFHNIKIIRLVISLSYSSYCMYLFHRPIYVFFTEKYFPSSDSLQLIYLLVFCFPCIAIFSFSVQKLYDNVSRKVVRSCSLRPKKHHDSVSDTPH